MSKSQLEGVVAHWNKLIENFATSPLEFYASVEKGLERRQIPGLKTSRVTWNEGGVLSPQREYLRVTGDRHLFDMCAAPFGTGFFFSSWLSRRPPRAVFLVFLLLLIVAYVLWRIMGSMLVHAWSGTGALSFIASNALVNYGLTPFVAISITLWLVALTARAGNAGLELAVLAIPVVGWIYESFFAPVTYFRLDSMSMFQSAVQAAMHEAIDGVTTQKGLRALTEDERKPVFQKLL